MSFLSKLFRPPVPGIEATAVQAKLNEKPRPLVLDVREPSEYAAGHIAGSTLIPVHQLSSRMSELPKDREIICVCASGSRSSSAARQLASNGYHVLNLSGGMSRWQRAGLPVKKGAAKSTGWGVKALRLDRNGGVPSRNAAAAQHPRLAPQARRVLALCPR